MDTFIFANLPGCRCCLLAGGSAPGFEESLGFSQVSSKIFRVGATGLVHKGVSSIHRERNSRTQDRMFAFGPDGGLVACVTVVSDGLLLS